MQLLTGHTLKADGDENYVRLVDEHTKKGTRFFSPSAYLVNTLPIRQFASSCQFAASLC